MAVALVKLRVASLRSPREVSRNAEDVMDTMLFKRNNQAKDDLNRHESLVDTPSDPAVKTTESYVKENASLDVAVRVKRALRIWINRATSVIVL